jgi:hypothetical protein
VGTYPITWRATSAPPDVEPLTKEKRVSIEVTVQPERLRLDDLALKLAELRMRAAEYEEVGINVTDIFAGLDRVEELLGVAHRAVDADRLDILRTANDEAERVLLDLELRLAALALWKLLLELKWFILTGLVLAILTLYWITQVTLPYHRLGQEITQLREKEKELIKAREAAEMDYFRRRIDEVTFRTIMTEKQSEILETREAIKLKVRTRAELVVKRLSPAFFARWVTRLPASLAHALTRLARWVQLKIKLKVRPPRPPPRIPTLPVRLPMPKIPTPGWLVKTVRAVRYELRWKMRYRLVWKLDRLKRRILRWLGLKK